ncbi:MAG: hypothetical protein HY300_12375, partial [Verrucomicrobia bacterium]|nr:hypothetical protein [Verrucomicrobiota bacterium]
TQQMFFLARDSVDRTEPVAVTKLIEEAFQEAQTNFANKAARLEVEGVEEAAPAVVRGDAASLKHAFAEVLLNALQASPKDARVKVRWRADADEHQRTWLRVDVRDAGEGFSPEAARRASEAFFTTRVVGLGLGLTVTRRIVEMHDGKLEILPARPGEPGGVSICLPVDREWNGATRNGAQ